MTSDDIRLVLSKVQYLDRTWNVGEMGDGFFIQIMYVEEDVDTGTLEPQRGRKWHVPASATKSAVVQTALKAALTSAEHVVREHFTYKGARIFGPHFDIEDLVEICRDSQKVGHA